MKNYFNQLMNDGYEILISRQIRWPQELSDYQKTELLTAAIEFFREREEYEKCAVLKIKLNKISKVKVKRPRIKRSSIQNP